MRIKKTFQGSLPENTVVNTQSDSQTNAYSCEYANNNIKSKFDRLWSGSLAPSTTLNVPNANKYDLLLFGFQSAWNRNGYVIISKWQFGLNKAFEVSLVSGSVIQNQVNPSDATNNNFTIGGETSSKLTEVIGIKF